MFQVNDTICYGTHGVCKIIDITKKEFGGVALDYYVLEPVHHEKSTIYVPLHNQSLTGRMQRVLSPEEIHQIIQSMPEEETKWIANEHERRECYRIALEQGDRKELMRLIKTIYLHGQEQKSKGRKLYAVDEKFLHEAERLIYDEFALALDIKPNQVLPFIREQIEKREK
ncbi:MAG: CarD family transcriptional regulator [Ruminococcaceae bacterium]|nr:CarD family transcriptional regulator [Oscillospiraceae bacterium]